MFVLSEIFEDCPQVKIVEAFAENYENKLYATDIVRMTGVSKSTVYKHLEKLVAEGVVEEKSKAGKTRSYRLNAENPKAKIILMLKRFIIYERLDELLEKEPGEEAGQNPNAAAYGDEKPRHPAPGERGEGNEKNPASGEYFEYIDSYGVEATSKADSETYIIGNFESFEDQDSIFIFRECAGCSELNRRCRSPCATENTLKIQIC
ncbi:hypothetical protein MSMTP_1051 [Methanosarcina sp. MTP4]|uniref:winged helix-turn-helix domain-containing protein n=1 Tax=Methanosarcina sp. MTP4 TaxID=1434100 RepID=UPI000615BFE0|nr:ArsR family transcriptional regulator [Methanosarcina sp. MTP4]AKB24520.1 hypothetical protein MSMTP_1051 [Methanosarcina sp. MTP4]